MKLFRNYNYPEGSKSRYLGDSRTKLAVSLRASTAAPSYFDQYVTPDNEILQDGNLQNCLAFSHFIGGITANNPAGVAIHEAKCLWKDREIECIVSIGTGSPLIKSVKNKAFLPSLLRTLVRATTSPKAVHDILTDLLPENKYYRFNPVNDAMECGLDETNEERLRNVQEATRKYLEEIHEQVAQLCEILKNPKMS